jgi:hypothetical protein
MSGLREKGPNMLGIWKEVAEAWECGLVISGLLVRGPTRTRTWDRPIMSRML